MAVSSRGRVCVIGAGIAGLVTTKVLREDGFDVTAFEKEAAIGGVWAPSRTYPDLRANNPRETYAFSDHPYPATADEYPSADQVRSYLGSYVERFCLGPLIQLGTEVVDVRRAPSPPGREPGFEVTVQPADGSGSPQTLPFDFVVVCNGVFSVPQVPSIDGRARFGGQVLHSSKLANVAITRKHRVVVVGAGKSALDCAASAARRDASTTLIFRRAHWMVPRFFFGFIRTDKLLMNRFSEMFVKYHRLSRAETFLHGPGRWLVRLWWRLNTRIIRRLVGMPAVFTPDEPLSSGFANIGVGGEFYDVLQREKLVAKRATISRFTEAGVELDSGEHIAADIVIFATGWQQGVPFLAPELRDAVLHDGRFSLYRFILPPQAPRLGFIGYASSIACQFTSEIAAHWLSQSFRGELKLPSASEMEQEIARVGRWASEVVPGRDQGYFIGPFVGHYADDLLRDMGLPTRRRSNIFAEYMAPFWPERYGTLAADRQRTRGAAAYSLPTAWSAP